ncbi:MAG: PAS domain S-box protein [Algoriphagus sp.]|uniref:ATP-binding protein n=1 Tax=Algoriphagus sp. TaxID=1872435 RepID=UPI001828F94D|nr:ATP-binding protein [Algoriphagus sp.]NVJ85905.1 PAS domain S-box protein [Algoriphagus sp.]
MNRFLFLGLWLGFLFVGGNLSGQTFKFDLNPKGVNLPVQNIFQIEQDTLGRIWFSTSRGVFYSDGIQTYSIPDSLRSEFDYQISIHRDEDGAIWLYNDRGEFKFYKGGYGDWEEVRFQGLEDAGLLGFIKFFTKGEDSKKEYLIDVPDYLFHFQGTGEARRYYKEPFKNVVLTHWGGDKDQSIFYFMGFGPYVFKDKWEPVSLDGISLPSPPLMVKKCLETGEFYFLGKGYLAKGSSPTNPQVILDQDFNQNYPSYNNLLGMEFSKGSVFYFFNSGLRKLKFGTRRPLLIDSEDIFRVFMLQDFMIDQEGLLWLVSSRGLANINNLAFQNYSRLQSGLLSDEVTAITLLPSGEYLLGFNNGIQKISRTGIKTLYEYPSSGVAPTSRIVNFSTAVNGGVWFSASFNGVGRLDLQTDRIEIFSPPEEENIASVQVAGDSLIITSSRNLYLASIHDRGQELYKNGIQDKLEEVFEGNFYHLRKAGKLSDGRMMVMRASRLENPRPLIQLPGILIAEGYDYLETEQGLLLGTEGGVKQISGNEVEPYFPVGKPINNPVFSILEDSQGAKWFGTDDGVFKYTGDSLLHFNDKSGLPNNETNRGALIEGNENRILIGTVEGLTIYFQDEKFISKGIPRLNLNSVKLGGDEILGGSKVETSYTDNTLEIDFSAIAFNREKELWVQYRLIGLEEDWELLKDPKSNRIFYPNIPPGNYQFEIKASFEGERNSPTFQTATFEVLQPFYLRFWFILLLALFLIGLGVLIQSFYSQLRKLGILRTVVDRKDQEKARAEEQFKNVWDSSKDALLLTIDGEKIIAVNPVFTHWLLREEEQLKGSNLSEVLSDNSFCEVYAAKLKALPQEGETFEKEVFWPIGKMEMEIYLKQIPSKLESGQLLLTVFRDVTAEKEIEKKLREAKEKAEEANRFKTSLLSNVSHEIRTPLNVILGGTEHVMMTRQNDPKLLAELDIILQSGERLLTTITSILDMAKIEAKKMKVIKTDTAINAFIEKVIPPLHSLASKKGLKITTKFLKNDINGPLDQRFTEIILNNLIGNAIKYSDQGEITVTVSENEGNLILEVADRGVGISEEFLPKVFQPFEQESTGNQRQFEGTGLGMTITKNLVKILGGKIQIQSKKGEGTIANVEIPLTES